MSIQIIDNFELNSAKPIDNRFVVGPGLFYTNKSQITNLYNGLRIWDLTVGAYGLPYVWDGTAWQSENSVSMSGGGTINYVPRFNTTSSIVDSIIQDDGTGVGIGTAPSASYKLDVSGSVRSQGLGFYGNGSNITNINATNISTGNLAKERLPNGATGHILVASSGGGGVYTNPSTLTVGSATSLVTSSTLWGRAFNGTSNVFGNISNAGYIEFGTHANKAILSYGSNFTLALNVPAQTAMLSVRTLALLEQAQNFTAINNFTAITKFANGTLAAPGISFGTAPTTGIYLVGTGSSGNIRISIAGSDKMIIEANAINFGPWGNYYPRVRVGISSPALLPSYTWFGNDNTGIFRPAQDVVGISTDGVERMRVSNSGVTIGSGNPIKTNVSGYVKFTRNSNGTGFSYAGYQSGGVTGVTDVSLGGSSFTSTAGYIQVRIAFPANTFIGGKDDNVVFAQFGLDDTNGSIYQEHKAIQGKVVSNSEIDVRMDFPPIAAALFNIRLNFIVQSL